jgi:hypothetical protein
MAHLRSPLHELPWYQLMLLDVIGFLLLVAAGVGFVIFSVAKCTIKKISGAKKSKTD